MERKKVVIVDDELPALEILLMFVKKRPELEIVLATTQFQKAWDYLDENDIDLLIVDLDLRVDSGYRLMGAVEEPTQIIVCTASENEGTKAIGNGAIDFLTKLVEEERFNYAIDLALKQMELLENRDRNKMYPPTVVVPLAPDELSDDPAFKKPNADHYKSFRAKDLVYARSDGKTTRLFFIDGSQLLVKLLMRDFQSQLEPLHFIRIQKGYLVNREFIGDYKSGADFDTRHWWIVFDPEVIPTWKGNTDKGKLPVGGKYRYRVERALNIRK